MLILFSSLVFPLFPLDLLPSITTHLSPPSDLPPSSTHGIRTRCYSLCRLSPPPLQFPLPRLLLLGSSPSTNHPPALCNGNQPSSPDARRQTPDDASGAGQQETPSRGLIGPRQDQRVSGLAEQALGRCKLQTNAAKGLHSSHDTGSSLNVVKPSQVCASPPAAPGASPNSIDASRALSCFTPASCCCNLGLSPPNTVARCPQIVPESATCFCNTLLFLPVLLPFFVHGI